MRACVCAATPSECCPRPSTHRVQAVLFGLCQQHLFKHEVLVAALCHALVALHHCVWDFHDVGSPIGGLGVLFWLCLCVVCGGGSGVRPDRVCDQPPSTTSMRRHPGSCSQRRLERTRHSLWAAVWFVPHLADLLEQQVWLGEQALLCLEVRLDAPPIRHDADEVAACQMTGRWTQRQ